MHCFRCNKAGHVATECQENASGWSCQHQLAPQGSEERDAANNQHNFEWKEVHNFGEQVTETLCMRYWSTTFPNRSGRATKLNFRNENELLLPYLKEKLGPPNSHNPTQQIKSMPRKLSQHVDTFTTDADICVAKFREWHKKRWKCITTWFEDSIGLQVCIDESLWLYQTLVIWSKWYCLTCLGFGLNMVPMKIEAIVEAILSQEDNVKEVISTYIDNIFVNDNVALTQQQGSRAPEGRNKGIRSWSQSGGGTLWWKWEKEVPDLFNTVMWQNVFFLSEKLVRHFPIYGWLRVASGFIKWQVNMIFCNWDEELTDAPLKMMIQEKTIARMKQNDSIKGEWCATGNGLLGQHELPCDWSIAGKNCVVFEDACWLHPDSGSQHINFTKLDAIIKCINLALQW